MTFHENLLRLRTTAHLTQQQTADGAGLSMRGYQNYERGLREPNLSTLVALADFYGITVDRRVCNTRSASSSSRWTPDH